MEEKPKTGNEEALRIVKEADGFWQSERRRLLKSSIKDVLFYLGYESNSFAQTSKNIITIINSHGLPKNCMADPKTYAVILKTENRRTNPRFLTVILLALGRSLATKEPSQIPEMESAKIISELHSQMVKLYPNLEELFHHMASKSSIGKTDGDKFEQEKLAIREMFGWLGLKPEGIDQIKKMFFRNSDENRVFFETFRYSSEVGMIQKSFTTILWDTKVNLFRFNNTFEGTAGRRSTSGIVLPFEKEVIFFGSVDKGATGKMFAIQKVNNPSDIYCGLLSTVEQSTKRVSANFVLKRTERNNHKDVDTKLLTEKQTEEQIGQHLLRHLENSVDFSLDQRVFDEDGNALTHREIQHLLDDALKKDGKSQLFNKKGKPFNPAFPEDLPFNSALSVKNITP